MVKFKMYLDDETYEELKGEVAHYLVQCSMSYPLNIDNFAYKLGIEFIPYSELGKEARIFAMHTSQDGFLCEKNRVYASVFFNDEKKIERQNMSKMHEIGHYVLDHNSTRNKPDEEKEAESKFFARYAMAPMPLIHLLPIVTVETIQKAFGLSHEAASYAFANYKGWLRCFNGKYKDYEQKILNLERNKLDIYISELKENKERQSERYQPSEWKKRKLGLASKSRGQAFPLQDHNSTPVQGNIYEVRQMAGP